MINRQPKLKISLHLKKLSFKVNLYVRRSGFLQQNCFSQQKYLKQQKPSNTSHAQMKELR